MNQPASDTKHIKALPYTLPDGRVIELLQDDTLGDSTGRSLWLGAQLLVLYLHSALHKVKVLTKGKDGGWKRRRAIELGAGTGLMSMYLHSQGYDVLSTDMPFIAHSCLKANFDHNPGLTSNLTVCDPSIVPPRFHAKGLDWSVSSSEWSFNDPRDVASTRGPSQSGADPEKENWTPPESPIDPPFDLIVLSDVIYSSALVEPLLNTLRSLSDLSPQSTTYIAVEVRDPELISGFFVRAKEEGWKCSKVDQLILNKLMRAAAWDELGWDGVEVWCLKRRSKSKLLVRKQA
ncbi:BZ3500_MvSof-1268-A1-R1_Chr4-4g07482 [Microbotryum saponariae]|uniref:BZ3500_MvSof-1268-A1-R1_Chr4-4g07482 protein n=1 Tax=Microbotryum saponariae TaxID=289078 RepID=A0A2X0KXJ3_9BASI|nr:BZ3500_MvSof-1268-A1-R1_Chr4-4g07482 [Microbotryum saponariae]SDA07143.1 BZ3501_MvSof-1269-A2-R1_Chr4-3g07190 [Microbotryum saponariae]